MKVSGSHPVSLTLVVIGALVAITAFLLFTPNSTVQADTFFDVSFDVEYCNQLNPIQMDDHELDGDPNCTPNTTPGAAQTTTTLTCIPGPTAVAPCTTGPQNSNFGGLVTFTPSETTITDGDLIPVGDKIGGLFNTATLGLINNPCSSAIPIPFTLFNVALPDNPGDPRSSTNIYTPYREGTSKDDDIDLNGDGSTDLTIVRGRFEKGQVEGIADRINDSDDDYATGASAAIQNYPDWLLDIFDPDWIPAVPAQEGPRTEIIDGLVDVDGDLSIETEDYGVLDGLGILAGKVDVDGDGLIETNGDDDGTIDVPFLGTRNVDDGVIDISEVDGAGDSADDYSSNLQNPNDGTAKPIVPLAVYGSFTAPEPASQDWVPLFFVIFSPGQLAGAGWASEHPFDSMTSDLGYPSITVLTDVSTVMPSISAISDFCAPLLSQTMFQGATGQCGNAQDDDSDGDVNDGCPAFGAAETVCGADTVDDDGDGVVNDGCGVNGAVENGGTIRATNPSTAGTYKNRLAAMSIRDTDNDGFENSYDTCPLNADTGDTDGDGINDSCDPTIGVNTAGGPSLCPGQFIAAPQPSDHDGDCFLNRQDNAPLAANGRPQDNPSWDGQANAESLFGGAGHGTPAADGGPASDAIGDLGDTGSSTSMQNGVSTTITMSTTVANGHYLARGLISPVCIGGTDVDGDGWCAAFGDPNDGNVNHFGPVGDPPPDTDGDTYDLWIETWLGTDATKACAATGAITNPGDVPGHTNDEPVDNFPPDLNDDQVVNLGDILFMAPPVFFSVRGTGTYSQRADLNGDGVVNLGDILFLAPPVFFSTCSPIAQQ